MEVDNHGTDGRMCTVSGALSAVVNDVNAALARNGYR